MSADDFPPPGPDTLELRMQRPNKVFVSATSRRDGEQSSYLVVSDGTRRAGRLFSTRPTFSDADFRFVAPRGAGPDKGR